ncbi:predicted protein [Chaetoceros tenuissimus]|uniref:Uncharacterized protein n=1 Tax=Chaetoceros tenuissimus TaxID=426638 RepID=A0AAD3CMU0_9STRA|nr:predicted protein [Chaetoceros tenuissimus]
MSYSVPQASASQKRPLQDHSNRPLYESQNNTAYTKGLKTGAPPPAVASCHLEQNHQIHQGTQTFGFNQGSHYQHQNQYHYQQQIQYGHCVNPIVQNASLPPPGYVFQNNTFLNAQGVHPQENGIYQGFQSQSLMMMMNHQHQQMQSNAMPRSKIQELKCNEKWRARHRKNDRNKIQGQHIGKTMFEAVSVSKHPYAIFAPYSSR